MPTQEYIKHLYENEDVPIKQIAERTGVSWRTAKKYAQKDDWNVERRSNRRWPVMDAVAEIVDTWLLEDRLLPRKERRNAAVIYRQLVSEPEWLRRRGAHGAGVREQTKERVAATGEHGIR